MFKELGYFKEYYLGNKFLGYIGCEKDRDIVGYNGRKEETPTENITLNNSRIIKAGQIVITILYPLNGR